MKLEDICWDKTAVVIDGVPYLLGETEEPNIRVQARLFEFASVTSSTTVPIEVEIGANTITE